MSKDVLDPKKWAWMEKMLHENIRRYKDGRSIPTYSREDCVKDCLKQVALYVKAHNTKLKKKLRKKLNAEGLEYNWRGQGRQC